MRLGLICVLPLLLSCASVPTPPAAQGKAEIASSLALLHGAHLDEGSWKEVQAELKNLGIESWTPKQRNRAKGESVTIDGMAQTVCKQLDEPAILVAHSLAGAVANQMLKHCPTKVVRIFYLAALVPYEGEKPFDLVEDNRAQFKNVMRITKTSAEPKGARAFLKVMDEQIDAKKAGKVKVYPEPLTLNAEAIATNMDRLKAIPKVYIGASADKVITPATQKKFTDRTAFEKVLTLPTGHLPQLSNPEAVAKAIKDALL